MVAEGLIVASLCAAGIYSLIPKTDSFKKNKIKKEWYKIMDVTKTKNNLGETFEIKALDLYRYGSFDLKAKIPAGLTPENLQKLEKTLEYSYGGDVDIKWDKYNAHVLVKVNKDPIVLKQSIERKWMNILTSKEFRNRYKQYFDITEVTLNNNSSYILTITTPITLSQESLQSFKKLIEDNLKNEKLESFHNESNNIFITVSHRIEKDSL